MTVGSGTDRGLIRWVFLLLCLVLASIHLYLGGFASSVPTGSARQFLIIGVALLVGPVIYVTRYWRPVLYLIGACFVVYLGVLWLLAGMEYPFIGIITGITATSFIILALTLFVREESSRSKSV